MLSPDQIIDGCEAPSQEGVYVVGCYDTRITLYSQQVRALLLAHALHERQYLPANKRIAVIGGGAAGMTVAAALALQGDVVVHLFERERELMPLQGTSVSRRLDPHIYEWPKLDAERPRAELPILDWRSEPAASVRRDLLVSWSEIESRTGDRLRTHRGHDVTAVEPRGRHFDIRFVREGAGGHSESASQTVDLVVLAIGFGLEAGQPIRNTVTESYWSEAGVPGAALINSMQPRFFVSGNGDGGLIDFVAAASANFDHWAFVRRVTGYPDVRSLADELLAIDHEARAAASGGSGFDFIGEYDRRIGPRAEAIGLVDEVERLLRPGVQLTFQTREAELLTIRTAALNRLAAYLVIRACQRPGSRAFRHVVCDDVTVLTPPIGHDAAYLLGCGATQVKADRVIARRGPLQEVVRAPFASLLAGFGSAHDAWLAGLDPADAVPVLSEEARRHFRRLAHDVALPPPQYLQAETRDFLPLRARVDLAEGTARWTGDLPIKDAAEIWDTSDRTLIIHSDCLPADLGPLAHALTRLAMHSDRCSLAVDAARWRRFLTRITVNSIHADELALPRIRDGNADVSVMNGELLATAALAEKLNAAMDLWVLKRMDAHITPYVLRGVDEGSVAQLRAAPELRQVMAETWAVWRDAFRGDPSILSRYLRLAICSSDDEEGAAEAAALVGPRKLKSLIRATAAALVIAAGWRVLAPSGQAPGNLLQADGVANRSGHACAAAMIGGMPTALAAARHMWTTHFVVLPMENGSVRAAALAARPFNASDQSVPSLRESEESAAVILTLDEAFMAAAASGAQAVVDLLAQTEEAHFEQLRFAIETREGEA